MLEKLQENKKALILFILILFMICIGISYAYWYLTHIQSGTNQVVTDCFDIEFIEESEAITLSKAYPMTDEEGSTLTISVLKEDEITNALLENMIDLLSELAESYPKNIKIKEDRTND